MVSYAIIGASRGIGLEYVRQLAARPDATVFAIVRTARTSTHLAAAVVGLNNVYVFEADVAEFATLEAAAKSIYEITGGTLDCLIHNAARMESDAITRGFDDFASMDALDAEFITSFRVNTLGVIHSIMAFYPLLRASTTSLKKIVVLSTSGAIPHVVRKTNLQKIDAYCVTKASGLMVTTKWAVKLKDEGFAVVSMNPGVVDTSDTGDEAARAIFSYMNVAKQTPAESVAAQIQMVDNLTPSDNGLFLSYNGEALVS